MIHWVFLALCLVAITGAVVAHYADSWSLVETLAAAAVWVGLVGGVIVGVVWGALALTAAECSQIERSTGYDTEFYALGGCFVVIEDGRELPVDERSIGFIVQELADD